MTRTPLASLALAAVLAIAPLAAHAQTIDCRRAEQVQAQAQQDYEHKLASFKAARKQVDDIRADFDRKLLAATSNGSRHLDARQGAPYDEQWQRLRELEARLIAYLDGVVKAGQQACAATEVFTEPGAAGERCYKQRQFAQTRIDICIGIYDLQNAERDRATLPASWREDFRYQR